MIPARMGSTRLKLKNLALLDEKPVIAYAIAAARAAGCFDRIIVNSDGPIFAPIAERYGAEFYQRSAELGSSTTKSDLVVYDFVRAHSCDIVVWVNPIAPLQTGDEVRQVVEHFVAESLDSLITVKNEQVHCVYEGKPVNFRVDEVFAQTQELKPVQCLVYSIMIWRTSVFIPAFEQSGFALLSGKVGYFPVSAEAAIIIKTESNLRLAEHMLQARQHAADAPVEYAPEIRGVAAGKSR